MILIQTHIFRQTLRKESFGQCDFARCQSELAEDFEFAGKIFQSSK
jgi:hypothetical protein